MIESSIDHEKTMLLTTQQAAPNLVTRYATGRSIDLSAFRGKKVLIKFHRFSGCPVARMQIDEFLERHGELNAAGVETVILLHNRAEKVVPCFREASGVHVVADPGKEHYRRFGSQFRWSKLLSLASWRAAFVAFIHGYFPHFHRFEGGIVAVPSDFLVDERGVIVDLQYGKHFGDSWSVSDVLGRVVSKRAANAFLLPRGAP